MGLNFIDYYDLSSELSKESIELIWNQLDLKQENKNKQPVHNVDDVIKFINEKKLPNEFYPYYEVSYGLLNVLKKCDLYKTIKQKFIEYANKSKNVEPNKEYKIALNDIFSKVKIIQKDFNGNNVKFKKFENIDNNLCFKDNDLIYFSSNKLKEILNEKWKFWIFIKILNVLDVKIENAYMLFDQIFKKPIIHFLKKNQFHSIITFNILKIYFYCFK